MLGLTLDDYTTEYQAEVWPDNALAVDVFVDLQTQWRVGQGGRYGLDYAAIPSVLEMLAVDRGEWPDLFRSLRIMESAALEEFTRT